MLSEQSKKERIHAVGYHFIKFQEMQTNVQQISGCLGKEVEQKRGREIAGSWEHF